MLAVYNVANKCAVRSLWRAEIDNQFRRLFVQDVTKLVNEHAFRSLHIVAVEKWLDRFLANRKHSLIIPDLCTFAPNVATNLQRPLKKPSTNFDERAVLGI
jgi:hypothetical protein